MNNVQVNLQFTANTQQAKQELANLQTQLTSLINQPVPIGAKMTADIQKATAAAAELKVHLQNATNVKTGMLDFGKLNQSIKQSGMSLSEYGAQLQALGPQGQQAFMQLANSVAAAEVPIRRASGALTGMLATFKNTAKWMVSSTVLNGFIRTMSSAYGYAQDLNESLNNIRIVTGQNIDQMAKFAAEANKAAKALSTTTTEYTNASLIYYQQGLNDQQVKERTDVTIKMANVSRQAAETVSDQMTAVWNNFYDGSKSLESYADALTALGAVTASSTDEIAQGLEKFAAIADTVGLSYEYATAALATVTAQTRQSADVVGTAFKTLFARIQDLKLGETLDDGTTLGQYSEALNKIGVNIKGANGELKDMDIILNGIGAKWKNLERDEQAALAKAVGGLRQYNQFIALMDNWDFMQENLQVVENSTGTLQKQADIYAESWEAASKRVKASAEEVYGSLLNDKFFIELNNSLADFIGFLGKAIEGLGGVKGLLLMLGTIATKVFSTQIAQGLRNMAYNMQMMTKSGREAVQAAKQKEMDAIRSQMTSYSVTGLADETAQQGYTKQLEAQSYIIENAHKLTDMEKNKAQILLDQANYMAKQSVEYAKQLELLKEQRTSQAMNIRTTLGAAGMSQDDITSNLTGLRSTGEKMGAVDSAVRNLDSIFASNNNNAKQLNTAIEQLDNAINGLGNGEDTAGLKELMKELKGMRGETDNAKSKLAEISGELNVFGAKAVNSSVDLKELEQRFVEMGVPIKDVRATLNDYLNTTRNIIVSNTNLKTSNKNVEAGYKGVKQAIDSAKGAQLDWATVVTNTASTLMNVGMIMMQVSSLVDTLNNPDTSGWEKFTTVLMTLGMIVPSLLMVFKSFKSVLDLETIAKIANAAATMGQVAAEKKLNREKGLNNKETKKSIKQTWQNTKDTWNKSAMQKDPRYTQDARGVWHQKGQKGAMSKAQVSAAESAAGKQALAGLGMNVAAFAVVAASIAAAGFIIKGAMDSYNEDANKAKEAAELAKKAQENYDKQKESYNTFKASADEYNNARDGLEKLTKGTIEYEEAVQQANEQALKLLETNKNLQYTYNYDTGLIEIDEASLAAAQRAQLKQMKSAQDASIMANMESNAAALRYRQTTFGRNKLESSTNFDSDDAAWLGGGLGGGAALAAGGGITLGLVSAGAANAWNPVGWALIIAGAVTAAIGAAGALGNDAEEVEYKALEKLAVSYADQGNAIFEEGNLEQILKEANITDPELIASLKENKSEVMELVKEMAANTIETKKNTEAIIGDVAGDAAGSLSGYYAKEAARYDAQYSEMIDNIQRTEDYEENEDITKFIDLYDEIMDSDYGAKLRVGTNDVQMTDNGMAITWMENGQQQVKLLTELKNELKTASAKNSTAVEAAALDTKFDRLAPELRKIAMAATTSEGKFGGTVSKKELEVFQVEGILDEQGNINREKLKEFLINSYGQPLEEIADNAQFEGNVEALLNRYNELSKVYDGYNELYANSAEEVQSYYEMLLSNEAVKKVFNEAGYDINIQFRDFLSETFRIGGLEGIQMFHSIWQDLPDSELDEFVNNIDSIDWESATPESLARMLKEWGIETDISENKLQNWINTMRNGIIGIEALTKQTRELLDILDGLKAGDTISADEYQKLIDAELGLENYFTMMYDGTYRLIDAAIDFEQILKDNFVQEAKANLKESKQAYLTVRDQALNTKALLDKASQGELREGLKVAANNDMYNYWVGDNGQLYSWNEAVAKQRWETYNLAMQSGSKSGKIAGPVVYNNKTHQWEVEKGYEDEPARQALAQVLNEYSLAELYLPEQYDKPDVDRLAARSAGQAIILQSTVNDEGKYFGDESRFSFKNGGWGYVNNVQLTNEEQSLAADLEYMWNFVNAMDPEKTLLNEKGLGKEFDLNTFVNKETETIIEQKLTDLNGLYEAAVTNYQKIVNEDQARYEAQMNSSFEAITSTATTQQELLDMYHDSDYADLNAQARADMINQQSLALRDAEEVENIDAKELDEYTDYLMQTNELLGINRDLASEVARRALRQQAAIEQLSENYADWNNILRTANPLSAEYAEAFDSLTNAVSDYLGVSQEAIQSLPSEILQSADFASLLEQAMSGDENAYKELGSTVAEQLLSGLEGVEEYGASNILDNLLNNPDAINTGYIDYFNTLLTTGAATASQLEDIFNALHLEPIYAPIDESDPLTYSLVEKEATVQSIHTTRTYDKNEDGSTNQNSWTDEQVVTTSQKPSGIYDKVPTKIVNFKKVNLPGGSTSTVESAKSKKSTPDKKSKSDVVERYKEVNDQLDNVQNAFEDASKAMDRLYGNSRIKQMQEMNKMLANEVDLLRQKRIEAEEYYGIDQNELNQVAQKYIGTTFKFDENTGDITNYTEVMTAVWDNYDKYYESAKSGGFSDDEQTRLDEYEEAISKVQEAVGQYDETRELIEDIDDEIQAKLYEMQDRNYEIFTYGIDMELEIRDLKLEYNQYQLDKVMNDLVESSAAGVFNNLMSTKLGLLEAANNSDELQTLNNLYDTEQISQADYIEGLKTQYQTTMDNINALKEYDATMQSYYGDTLAAANEEIDQYVSLMTNANSVLEHYKNLMELTGKATNYQVLGKILQGQVENATNALAVSKTISEARALEAQSAQMAYEEALAANENSKQIELLKELWLTAQQAANEAQEQMLSDTEAWAEAQTALLENTLADLGKTLEEAITGGSSYADLSTAMERAAAAQEEYLTTTNKVYETNKLINKVQQEIDKTTNTAAKRRMQNFVKETEQLQKQSRLSNFELEIQQAKYELLLAEIALEEAQNAKSTVRLQRDAEGNFGYVYTADQNAIDDAAQKLQDAENDLYNIRLEGANDYAQKSIELQIEFANAMQELNERYQNGEFASMEAYQQAVLLAKEYYYNKLKDYSYLYSVATVEDLRVVEDAWSSEFSSMVNQTDFWAASVSKYISDVEGAFNTWGANLSTLYAEGGVLNNIEQGVSGVNEVANNLKELLVGSDGTSGIVKNVNEATQNALNLATEYGKIRDVLIGEGGLVEAYEKQIEEIIGLIEAVKDLDGSTINVDQTLTYKIETGTFDDAVRIFSEAVGDFADGDRPSINPITATVDNQTVKDDYKKATGIKLRDTAQSTYAWTMDSERTTLTRQELSNFTNEDLAKATVVDAVHVGGQGGMVMYGIRIGSDIFYVPASYTQLIQPIKIPTSTGGGGGGRAHFVMQAYDTGGYTGEWGPEGKLAWLHEKELVLKPEDTTNFLSALGLLDNIIATIDNYSVSAQLGGLLSSPAFQMNNQDMLEQNVHIEASFPGVQDRNEIEEVFNNLINKASQYANRKF